MTKANVITVVALGVVIVGILTLLIDRDPGGDEVGSKTYTNEIYGFTFSYPDTYAVNEYSSQELSVGVPREAGFESHAESAVILSGEEEVYENFEAFAAARAKLLCSADAPNVTVYCDRIDRRKAFVSASGLVGEEFHLTKTERRLDSTAETNTSFGPVIVFNISANTPGSRFAGLFVSPPQVISPEALSSPPVRTLAESLRIKEVEREKVE